MNQKYLVFGFKERELQALVGLLRMKRLDIPEESHTKFKKNAFQIEVLKKIYEIINLPSTATKRDLSVLLEMPEKSVKVWFQNSRQAYKRTNSDVSVAPSVPCDIPIGQILEIMKSVKVCMSRQE